MNCTWNVPGLDPYTGTAQQAIQSMTGIPGPARLELIRLVKTGQFQDQVEIKKNSIQGRWEYEPALKSMSFGSKGKVCDVVTRKDWKEDHTEGGLVFCSGSYCVVRPAVCNNWAILTRKPVEKTLVAGAAFSGSRNEESTQALSESFSEKASVSPLPSSELAKLSGPALPESILVDYSGLSMPPYVYPARLNLFSAPLPLPPPPLPELPVWLLVIVGVGIILWSKHRGQTLQKTADPNA